MQDFEIRKLSGVIISERSCRCYNRTNPPTNKPYQNLHPQQAAQFQSHDNIAISPSLHRHLHPYKAAHRPTPTPIYADAGADADLHSPSPTQLIPHSSSGNSAATVFQESNTIRESNNQQQQASQVALELSRARRGRDASGEGHRASSRFLPTSLKRKRLV
ncbi:hypothetical protein PABG_12348 [Paracoccidioides brasiliensis Pb03]|nr:hypothetical protein PABG_12348 [Paracoccidioides brasiliensis Pb03]